MEGTNTMNVIKEAKLLLFPFLFTIVGCSQNIERSMVLGIFIANHTKGIDSLIIRPDGTYLHSFTSPIGEKFVNSNNWEFELLDGEPHITFSRFLFRLEGHGRGKPGVWIVKVERSWGKLRLTI